MLSPPITEARTFQYYADEADPSRVSMWSTGQDVAVTARDCHRFGCDLCAEDGPACGTVRVQGVVGFGASGDPSNLWRHRRDSRCVRPMPPGGLTPLSTGARFECAGCC
jgi:hypothetical protein